MYNKQKGAAAVLFMCMLPLMIGFFAFTTQVVQHLQSDAKLLEATEVATLALIATSTGKNKPDDKLAEAIVDRYIPNNKEAIEIQIQSVECDYDNGCMSQNKEVSPYSDYTVTARSKHESWISFGSIEALKPEFTVSSSTVARKYLPKPVDIYFIVDMSESMGRPFRSDRSRKKIDVVKSTIKNITKELERFNKHSKDKSRVAFIGYNHYNVQKIDGINYFSDQVINDSAYDTVREMFDNDKKLFLDSGSNSEFYDIDLTDDYEQFNNEIKPFVAKEYGSTRSWQGVIRAAQVTDSQAEYNAEQIIIVMSDGADARTNTLPNTFLKSLVKRGLCENIVNNLEGKVDRHGNKLNVIFSVIGIDFYLDENKNGFFDCVGEDNIYAAKQGDDVYKYIISLINEETGRLKL
ncbi:VWA domain-containing protein [Photobacterium swingsii]|uniref:TadE/TadG family type IV pilus assembly protein n=1 Tax=Photobacterium swingsii TaxID=680026 RepID=UPI003D0CC1AC